MFLMKKCRVDMKTRKYFKKYCVWLRHSEYGGINVVSTNDTPTNQSWSIVGGSVPFFLFNLSLTTNFSNKWKRATVLLKSIDLDWLVRVRDIHPTLDSYFQVKSFLETPFVHYTPPQPFAKMSSENPLINQTICLVCFVGQWWIGHELLWCLYLPAETKN